MPSPMKVRAKRSCPRPMRVSLPVAAMPSLSEKYAGSPKRAPVGRVELVMDSSAFMYGAPSEGETTLRVAEKPTSSRVSGLNQAGSARLTPVHGGHYPCARRVSTSRHDPNLLRPERGEIRPPYQSVSWKLYAFPSLNLRVTLVINGGCGVPVVQGI